MSTETKWNKRAGPVLLVFLTCVAVSLIGSAMPVGASLLPPADEIVLRGGSDCSDFMNGAAVGLGVGALFGCLWCAGGAIVAKGIALFC